MVIHGARLCRSAHHIATLHKKRHNDSFNGCALYIHVRTYTRYFKKKKVVYGIQTVITLWFEQQLCKKFAGGGGGVPHPL